jgi:murein DD-endopeptidase MepM/ murein hydrolase activator NlpD
VLLVVAATEPELRGAGGAETLVCGIGPVDAAAATARALAASRADALLHVGIAGCRRGCGLALGALVAWLSVRYRTATPVTPVALPAASAPAENTNVNAATPASTSMPAANDNATPNSSPSPSASASALPTPPPANTNEPARAAPTQAIPPSVSGLLIPVAGVRAEDLHDTYNEARSEGRVHNAIDIMSPCGTPVLATADGPIVKLFQSERGGTTIYQRSTDDRVIYYYAHLQRYADGLSEGRAARRGETIAYVGDTGNAGAGNCHLHFAIWLITDPKRYWDGANVNPYPLLKQ